MNYKLQLSTIAIVFLLITANISAQDYDRIDTHDGDNFEYNRNTIHNSEFIINSDTIKNESPVQVPVDSTGEILQHSIFVGILSINYSRIIHGDNAIFTVGGGLSFAPAAFEAGGVGLMVEATLLKGNIKHFFEPGLLMYFDLEVFAPMLRLGYRYQHPDGFLFRTGLLFTYIDGFTLLPALSIGYSF